MERQREREKRRQMEWEREHRDLVDDALSTDAFTQREVSRMSGGPISSRVDDSARGSRHATPAPVYSWDGAAGPRQTSHLSASSVDHGPRASSDTVVGSMGSASSSLRQSSHLSARSGQSPSEFPGQSTQTVPGLGDVVADILSESTHAVARPPDVDTRSSDSSD